MSNYLQNPKMLLFGAFLAFISCDDDEKPNLRPSIDYSILVSDAPYSEQFLDEDGKTTVDLTAGNDRHKMFQALNYYSSVNTAANTHIDGATLQKMFTNTANPFVDIATSTISIVGANLNSSDVQLRDVVASSRPTTEAEAVRTKIESLFTEIDAASNSLNVTASAGVAGKLGTYLVDAKGIEIIQIIQKSLIGALELDYIGNVLMDEGLTADNNSLVGDHNYTQLEQNWDEAYGLLTLNPVFLLGSTDATRGTVEFGAGAYIWEYNKANYANIFPAFLKGRAAIVNNDLDELQVQATFIRTEFEKAIANSALGYLDKWKTGATDAARAHAIGEGLGFIYSLRFATIHGADATFSDTIITGLVGSTNGFWDLDAAKINTAADAIKAKFGL